MKILFFLINTLALLAEAQLVIPGVIPSYFDTQLDRIDINFTDKEIVE